MSISSESGLLFVLVMPVFSRPDVEIRKQRASVDNVPERHNTARLNILLAIGIHRRVKQRLHVLQREDLTHNARSVAQLRICQLLPYRHLDVDGVIVMDKTNGCKRT